MEIQTGVSTTALALYAAVVSTVTAVVQLLNHLRDRAEVVLKEQRNMQTAGADPRYTGITFVIITATNTGRRPVTIAGFAAKLLQRENEKSTDWYLPDVRPQVPYEITEGKQVAAFVDQSNVQFNLIAFWYAWDTAGRQYRLNVAPWHKRWITQWKRKHAKGT